MGTGGGNRGESGGVLRHTRKQAWIRAEGEPAAAGALGQAPGAGYVTFRRHETKAYDRPGAGA